MNEMDSADEMDAALDARLRAAFAPPRDVQGMARDVLAQSGAVRPVPRWKPLHSVAAIFIVAIGLGWLSSRDLSTPPAQVFDAGILHTQIAADLGQPFTCISPLEESSLLVTQIVGTQLDYRGAVRVPLQGPFALPADWSGDPAATVLAGRFEGLVVVVVIGSAELDCGLEFDPKVELLVHRRELGSYILYELSSGEAPVCLDEFSLGDIR